MWSAFTFTGAVLTKWDHLLPKAHTLAPVLRNTFRATAAPTKAEMVTLAPEVLYNGSATGESRWTWITDRAALPACQDMRFIRDNRITVPAADTHLPQHTVRLRTTLCTNITDRIKAAVVVRCSRWILTGIRILKIFAFGIIKVIKEKRPDLQSKAIKGRRRNDVMYVRPVLFLCSSIREPGFHCWQNTLLNALNMFNEKKSSTSACVWAELQVFQMINEYNTCTSNNEHDNTTIWMKSNFNKESPFFCASSVACSKFKMLWKRLFQ